MSCHCCALSALPHRFAPILSSSSAALHCFCFPLHFSPSCPPDLPAHTHTHTLASCFLPFWWRRRFFCISTLSARPWFEIKGGVNDKKKQTILYPWLFWCFSVSNAAAAARLLFAFFLCVLFFLGPFNHVPHAPRHSGRPSLPGLGTAAQGCHHSGDCGTRLPPFWGLRHKVATILFLSTQLCFAPPFSSARASGCVVLGGSDVCAGVGPCCVFSLCLSSTPAPLSLSFPTHQPSAFFLPSTSVVGPLSFLFAKKRNKN